MESGWKEAESKGIIRLINWYLWQCLYPPKEPPPHISKSLVFQWKDHNLEIYITCKLQTGVGTLSYLLHVGGPPKPTKANLCFIVVESGWKEAESKGIIRLINWYLWQCLYPPKEPPPHISKSLVFQWKDHNLEIYITCKLQTGVGTLSYLLHVGGPPKPTKANLCFIVVESGWKEAESKGIIRLINWAAGFWW
jgi:hypothetical protein